jgi:hypothetical protein
MPRQILPFSPPPEGARTSPEITLQWILSHVPCFVGPVPLEWSEAVYRESMRWRIDRSTLRTALQMARRRGYEIDSFLIGDPRPPDGHAKIGPAKGSARERAVATAKALESRYEAAGLANNSKEMERLAKEFAALLNRAEIERLPTEEIQWGAPLLRRAIVYGGPQGGRGGPPSGGGPFRTMPVRPMTPPARRGR